MTYTISQVLTAVQKLGGSGGVAISICPANAITEECISNEPPERLGGIDSETIIEYLRENAKWNDIREMRNRKLEFTDWTALNDVSLSPEKKLEWQQYRQALRDITDQTDPENIVWPIKPQ